MAGDVSPVAMFSSKSPSLLRQYCFTHFLQIISSIIVMVNFQIHHSFILLGATQKGDLDVAAPRLSALFSVIEVSSSHLHKHAPSPPPCCTLHATMNCFTHPFADTVGGLLVLGGPASQPEDRLEQAGRH